MRETNRVCAWSLIFGYSFSCFIEVSILGFLICTYTITSLNMHCTCVLYQCCQINMTKLNTIFKMIILKYVMAMICVNMVLS